MVESSRPTPLNNRWEEAKRKREEKLKQEQLKIVTNSPAGMSASVEEELKKLKPESQQEEQS